MKTTQKTPPFQPFVWFGWEAYLEDPAFLWQQIVCWFKGHPLQLDNIVFSDARRDIREFSCSRCGICIQGTETKK